MCLLPIYFRALPASVKNAAGFLLAGWGWHFISLYFFLYNGEIPFRQVIACVTVVFLLTRITNWARWLCILCNALIIVTYVSIAITFLLNAKIQLGLVAAINIALFSLATYYFMRKDAVIFFKTFRQSTAIR